MSENNKPILIRTEGLEKIFSLKGGAKLHAVDGIDLEIVQGQTLGVVGESGCGKSTLGRSILRLIEPTGGKVFYDGKDITKVKGHEMRELRRNMQIIFQDPYASIDPRKSVIEAIAEYMLIQKTYKTKRETFNRAAELMDFVGLARRYANSYPHELDGGRRQRIGIARALAVQPEFIVLDEPISALDVSIQAQIVNLLVDLQKKMGLTYLFVAHDLSMVKHISDRVAVLYLGTLVELTTSEELYANPRHPYTQALLSAIPIPDPKVEAERDRKKIRLEGEVPSPINTKPGCKFQGRCKYAKDICRQQMPELKDVGNNHFVACHFCDALEENKEL